MIPALTKAARMRRIVGKMRIEDVAVVAETQNNKVTTKLRLKKNRSISMTDAKTTNATVC